MIVCIKRQSEPLCHARGVTIIESMVTIAALAILLGIAAPSFQSQWQKWQRDSAVKTFKAHLRLARAEALRTGRRVVVCNSKDAASCAPSTEKDWRHGWIVFIDDNDNNQLNKGESIVATASAQTGLQSMLARNNIRRFVFKPNGLMASGMTTVTVQPPDEAAYLITISRVGRVRSRLDE